jgi:acyl-CoA thioesterase-1
MLLYGLRRGALQALLALILALGAGTAEARDPVKVLAFGDSLTAGFGLPPDKSFPAQLEAKLKREGRALRIVNAGVSGDTTAGGLARLDWALADAPDIVILELGANDGLRGVEPKIVAANLDKIVSRLKAKGIVVLLAGMRAPPNMGRAYGRDFDAVFPELAKRHNLAFYPFFLEGVASVPKLNLPDGIHPTAEGIALIVEGIAPLLAKLIDAHAAK